MTATDGERIFTRRWRPTEQVTPRGIVQIVHGVAEHSGRYGQLAEALTAAGYLVVANDHRGHGRTAGERSRFGIAGPDGWNRMVGDLKQLNDLLRAEYPGVPIVMFAHSLGSLMAQQYLQEWGDTLHGIALCGTLGSLAQLDERLALIEQAIDAGNAERPSPVFSAIQAGFNKQFEPGVTWLDWLSRDEQAVRAYVADPLCRVRVCNQLAGEILRGGKRVWTDACEARIPKRLPILMLSGSDDPVSENTTTVRSLADRYRLFGATLVTTKFYPAARHELVHELNREEVFGDVIQFSNAVCKLEA